MLDRQKFVARYLLNDIAEKVCGKAYEALEIHDFELFDRKVSDKVVPLLTDEELREQFHLGKEERKILSQDLKEGRPIQLSLIKYETAKGWKTAGKAPGTAGRLVLARYFDFSDWKDCFRHFDPIVKDTSFEEVDQEIIPTSTTRRFNVKSLAYVAITISIGLIAFYLSTIANVFVKLSDERPAPSRKVEKTSPGPILVSSDSVTNAEIPDVHIIKPEKDLRSEKDGTSPVKKSVNEKPRIQQSAIDKQEVNENIPGSKPKISPRKAIQELGLSWDAKSLAESMSRGDLEAVSLFVEGGFPLQSDFEGASVILYAYHENAIDPIGVTDQLLKLGFDFTELLVDRKLIRQTSTDLPMSFWDDRLPKYDSYNKTFQGTLMMWLAQMVMWRGEKNHEIAVMKKLNERFTFDVTPKFIYHIQRSSDIPYPELKSLFADELIVAKREAFDLKRSLRFMSHWPEEYEVDNAVYHPIVPKDKDHIYVQKKGTFEIDVKPIVAGDFTDRLLQNYMEGKNSNRFMNELKTYGLGRKQFSSLADEIIFVFLYVTNESTTEMYKTVQPNFYNVSHDMVMVCPNDQRELIDFLIKNEVNNYDAGAIMTTGDSKTYYLNLYARNWNGEVRAVVTDKKGLIKHEFDSNEALKKYLIHGN